MSKKANNTGLVNTLGEKHKISQEEIAKAFTEDSKQKEFKRIVSPSGPTMIESVRRPTFEMPDKDYQKLSQICLYEKIPIGKKLFQIVKEWLDETEVK